MGIKNEIRPFLKPTPEQPITTDRVESSETDLASTELHVVTPPSQQLAETLRRVSQIATVTPEERLPSMMLALLAVKPKQRVRVFSTALTSMTNAVATGEIKQSQFNSFVLQLLDLDDSVDLENKRHFGAIRRAIQRGLEANNDAIQASWLDVCKTISTESMIKLGMPDALVCEPVRMAIYLKRECTQAFVHLYQRQRESYRLQNRGSDPTITWTESKYYKNRAGDPDAYLVNKRASWPITDLLLNRHESEPLFFDEVHRHAYDFIEAHKAELLALAEQNETFAELTNLLGLHHDEPYSDNDLLELPLDEPYSDPDTEENDFL